MSSFYTARLWGSPKLSDATVDWQMNWQDALKLLKKSLIKPSLPHPSCLEMCGKGKTTLLNAATVVHYYKLHWCFIWKRDLQICLLFSLLMYSTWQLSVNVVKVSFKGQHQCQSIMNQDAWDWTWLVGSRPVLLIHLFTAACVLWILDKMLKNLLFHGILEKRRGNYQNLRRCWR